MTKQLIRIAILLIVVAVVAGAYFAWQSIPQDEHDFAVAEVLRGDLVVKTFIRGELRAVRSLTLTAPNIGTQSQITQLAPTGALAKRGDLIFELDDSERVAALEDSLLEVEQINENLRKAEAELEIRKSQDEVEIVQANFQVRRAELEVQRNELLSAIDARKNELTLEEAQRRKQKLEADIKNRLQQREAELAVLREQLNKAQLDVERDERRIEQSRVLSPLTGLVSVLQNRSGGRGGFGQSLPEIREGDQIPAGMSVAQLLDLSEMELMTRVEESERANLREGQEVFIRLDAIPDKQVSGTIKRLGTTASANIFSGEATKKFECVIGIDMAQLLESVGAEPERIERILATARQNAAVGFGSQGNRQQNRAQQPTQQAEGGQQGARGQGRGTPEQGQQARGGEGQQPRQRGAGGQRAGQQGGQGQQQGQQARGGEGEQPRQRGAGGQRAGQQGGQGQQQGQQARGGEGEQPRQRGAGGQRAGQQGGQDQQQGRGGQGGGNNASRILSRLPDAARKQAEAMLKGRSPQDLSDEERQKFRQIMTSATGGAQGGGFGAGGLGGFGGAQGGPGGRQGGFGGAQGGPGGRQGGLGGGQAGAGGQGASSAASSGSEFSKTERLAATLPSPPEEGSDVEVLLRPGLLADAEVIVESIPDTLYIPYQAVFEEGAQTIVYVLQNGRLQARRIQLGRRSESQVAVVDGLAEGDLVSLYRPDSGPAAPAKTSEPSSGPSFPGGGASRGR